MTRASILPCLPGFLSEVLFTDLLFTSVGGLLALIGENWGWPTGGAALNFLVTRGVWCNPAFPSFV